MKRSCTSVQRYLGIIPSSYLKKHKILRILQTFLITSIWILVVYMHINKINQRYTIRTIGSKLLGASATIMRLFLILNSILVINIFQNQPFNELLALLDKIERVNHLTYKNSKNYTLTHFKVLSAYLILFCLEFMECFCDYVLFIVFLHFISCLYVLSINILFWNILRRLCQGLEGLHCRLKQYTKKSRTSGNIKMISNKCKENSPTCFITWTRLHILINKAVLHYNQLFGVQMLVSAIFTMLILIQLVREFLFENFEWEFDYMNVTLLMLFQVGEMVVIVRKCDELSNLNKHTTFLAYEAASYSPTASEREEVLKFAQQASNQCCACSAYGFFRIDNSLLFTMLELTTTYITVLFQFKIK